MIRFIIHELEILPLTQQYKGTSGGFEQCSNTAGSPNVMFLG